MKAIGWSPEMRLDLSIMDLALAVAIEIARVAAQTSMNPSSTTGLAGLRDNIMV